MNNYKDIFKMVFSGPVMIGEKLILSHEPVDIPWTFNIHGHIHDLRHKNDDHHFNVCAEAINYTPVNMNQWMNVFMNAAMNGMTSGRLKKTTLPKKNIMLNVM